MRRWLIILGVVIVLGVGGFFAFRAYSASQVEAMLSELQTVEAATGSLTATVGVTGIVRVNQNAILTFGTSGTVEQLNITLGDTVEAGQILATLEKNSLPAQVILAEADLVAAQRALDDILNSEQALAQAQRSVALAQDALKDAEYMLIVRQQGNRANQNTLDSTEASLILAENDVERAQTQFDAVKDRPEDDPARALALTNLAAARQKRDSVQRNLNWYIGRPTETEQALLDADVAFAEAQLADAEREWERLKNGPDPADIAAAEARIAAAEATMGLARVTAPFAGTITSVEVKPGDKVNVGTVAFGLADMSRLLVDVDVSEVDINRMQLGQSVMLSFDAVLDKVYQGEVIEIGLEGNIIQGVVNFKVVVELVDPDEGVKSGMTAAVNVVVSQIENALLVPNRAVRVLEGERVVYVLQEGIPEPVLIQLGVSSDTYSEVVGGELLVGDLIVLNPPTVFETNGPPPFVRQGQ